MVVCGYDSAEMKYWRLSLVVVVIIFVVIGIYRVRKKRAQQEREVAYQTALRSYSEALKPGMTRKEVEDYLRVRNMLFSQMCCVHRKDISRSVRDDLTKIGRASCRERV